MHATSQNILEAFNQLPEIEKHALASEIIKQIALLDFPPLTDEALTEIADALFVEHDSEVLRKFGNLQPKQLSVVENAVRQWLNL